MLNRDKLIPQYRGSRIDDWKTPDYFFRLLDNVYKFTLDPASSDTNAKCKKHFTKEQDGLKQNWQGEKVFVNPPFSDIDIWSKKCYEEGNKGGTTVVMLLPSRTDTKYWHNYIMKAFEIRFCVGRVNFCLNGIVQESYPFPLAVAIFIRHHIFWRGPNISSFIHKRWK